MCVSCTACVCACGGNNGLVNPSSSLNVIDELLEWVAYTNLEEMVLVSGVLPELLLVRPDGRTILHLISRIKRADRGYWVLDFVRETTWWW